MYRPPRAHHCRICKRCIRKMDHHCPWINNCVGEWNQKYFLQFLFYVGVLSAYSILLVAVSWSAECPQCPKDIMSKQGRRGATSTPLDMIFSVFLISFQPFPKWSIHQGFIPEVELILEAIRVQFSS